MYTLYVDPYLSIYIVYTLTMSIQVDAKSHYEQRCSELKMAVEKEKHTVRNEKRLGIGFFTFATTTDAQR